jgi:hypothetical protein
MSVMYEERRIMKTDWVWTILIFMIGVLLGMMVVLQLLIKGIIH